MDELASRLQEFKTGFKAKQAKSLNQHIYDLDLEPFFLSNLTQGELALIHVKLHASQGYKKPFAKYADIKEAHDKVSQCMDKHQDYDKLDS